MAPLARDAAAGPGRPGRDGGRARAQAVVITDARTAASEEMSGRVRRYTITMAFRTACFVAMIFVGGWPRWVLLGCAVGLPYIAVVLANAADQRHRTGSVEVGAPEDARALTAGPQRDVVRGDVVGGEVVEDVPGPGRADRAREEEPRGHVA